MSVRRVPMLGLIFALLVGLLPPGPALSAAVWVGPEPLTLSPTAATAGDTIVVAGAGFGPHEPLDATLTTPAGATLRLVPAGEPAVMIVAGGGGDGTAPGEPSLTAGADGALSFPLRTLENYQPGAWVVRVRGRESGLEREGGFTLAASPPSTIGRPLSFRGMETPVAFPTGDASPLDTTPAAQEAPAPPTTPTSRPTPPPTPDAAPLTPEAAPSPAATPAPVATLVPVATATTSRQESTPSAAPSPARGAAPTAASTPTAAPVATPIPPATPVVPATPRTESTPTSPPTTATAPVVTPTVAPASTSGPEATPTTPASPVPAASPAATSASPAPEASPAAGPTATPVLPLQPGGGEAGAPVVVRGATGAGANVRERPSASAPIVRVAPNGTSLTVTGAGQEADGYLWWPVRGDGFAGWIVAELVAPPAGPNATSPEQAPTADAGPAPPPPPLDGAPPAPAQLLPIFARASQLTGVPQEILLAIARVESGFSPRAVGPLIERFADTEDAHALGMMQFLPSTYRMVMPRVDAATGKGLGMAGIWDAESAIYAAAFYLQDSGAPDNLRRAIFAYNNADWYVTLILTWAGYYASGVTPDPALLDREAPPAPRELAAPQNPLLPSNGRALDMFSPIPLWAPFTAGQVWHVGGEGSFYGVDYHRDGSHYTVDFNKGTRQRPEEDDGELILAAADGTVNNIYQDAAGAWVVELYHLAPDGAQLRTLYVHLKTDPRIAPGIRVNQQVAHGTPIGFNGSSGNSTGPHLHFGLWILRDGGWVSIRPEPMEGVFFFDGTSITSTNVPTAEAVGAPRFDRHDFSPPGPSNADMVRIVAGARPGTSPLAQIEVYVNTAPDGSERGQWIPVGVVPGESGTVDWQTAPVADGTYRVLFVLVDAAGARTQHGLTVETAMRYTLRRGDLRGSAIISPRADLALLAPLDGGLLAQVGAAAPIVTGPLRFVPQAGPSLRPRGATSAADGPTPVGPTRPGHAAGRLDAATGLLVEEGTTNLVSNPSFERDWAGWTARNAPGGALDVTQIDGGPFGRWAVRLDNRAGSGEAAFVVVAGDGGPAAWSIHARSASVDPGPGPGRDRVPHRVGLAMSGLTPRVFDLRPDWRRVEMVGVTGGAGAERLVIVPAGGVVEIDAVQLEAKARVTSYADGSLGPGYGWAGTPHASVSGRLATTLRLPAAALPAGRGALGFWATPGSVVADGARLLTLGDRLTILVRDGKATLRWGDTVVGTARWEGGTARHYALAWELGFLTFLEDGREVGRAFAPDFAPPIDATLMVGSDPSGEGSANAVIQELTVWERPPSSDTLVGLARAREFAPPGAARAQTSTVTLALAVQGATPALMQFSFDGQTWSEMEPFASTKSLALPEGRGDRHVLVRYLDPSGRTILVADDIFVALPVRPIDLEDIP